MKTEKITPAQKKFLNDIIYHCRQLPNWKGRSFKKKMCIIETMCLEAILFGFENNFKQ